MEILGLEFQLTDSIDTYRNSNLSKFCYCKKSLEEGLFFYSHDLLFEEDVRPQEIDVTEFEGSKIFFQTQKKEAQLPFDPFAAAFYMMSRYEEYLEHKPDKHGRFKASSSLAHQHGFLEQPIVHLWVKMVKDRLQNEFPTLVFNEPAYQFTPTFDIDNAYAYLEKGVVRTLGAFLKAFLSFNLSEMLQRFRVLTGAEKDPYDSYETLNEIHKKYATRPIYFWLVGDYEKFDKNVSVDRKKLRTLIKEVSKIASIGLHPSYQSNDDYSKLKIERMRVEEIIDKTVNKSRQHYLKLTFPSTYDALIESGIEHDFSMGFAEEIGFRAGMTIPFSFFHLLKNEETNLLIHPFCVMDATLKYYKKYKPDEAGTIVGKMIDRVKSVNGCFYPIFHNESMGSKLMWKGWKDVYEQMLEKASKG